MEPKTLADQWEHFKSLMPPEFPDDMFDHVRSVFYAGAIAMNELFRNAGKTEYVEDSLKTVSALQEELSNYVETESRLLSLSKPSSTLN